MKLINTKTKSPLVEFKKDRTIIYNKYLEQEMKTLGIPIPHGLRGLFHGHDIVFLGDEDFQTAFKEIYYVTTIDPQTFQWVD